MLNACLWAEDEDGNWWTACNNGFVFTDGGPTENGMRFCCYCGRDLQVETETPEPEDDITASKRHRALEEETCG